MSGKQRFLVDNRCFIWMYSDPLAPEMDLTLSITINDKTQEYEQKSEKLKNHQLTVNFQERLPIAKK